MVTTTPTGFVNYSFNSEDLSSPEPPMELDKDTSIIVDLDLTNMEPIKPEPAILVRNACKSYKSRKGIVNVLHDFNMTVQQGSIYSLLGSSGCGKTTILSCCVGLKDLDQGEVRIFGAEPGSKGCGVPGRDVGYMPQETALYMELTIKEALQYFGRLFGMTFSAINKSMEFLIHLLALPPPHRRIGSLSGGQMRRVSFCIALLHSPKLMILDEPTVGVDPLLRQSIWNHLVKLVSTGNTTVVITTHYIEEARQSNQIGLMRGGKILAEDCPISLLKRFNTNLLEDIVLKLCLQDSSNEEVDSVSTSSSSSSPSLPHTRMIKNAIKDQKITPLRNNISSTTVKNGSVAVEQCEAELKSIKRRKSIDLNISREKPYEELPDIIKNDGHHSGKVTYDELRDSVFRISAMSVKNVIFLLRNIPFLLFVVFVPASQVIIVCIAIGQDPLGLKFGLVNLDVQNASMCQSGIGCVSSDNYTGSISCQYLEILERHGTLDLKIYEREEDAEEDVKNSATWGYLLFPNNYTTSMKDRALFGAHAEVDTIYGSRIKFRLDQSNLQIYRETAKVFLQSFRQFMQKLATDCDIDPILTELPFYFDKPIFGQDSITFTDFLAPSIFLAVMFFFPLCGSGIAYITEKKSGTLARILVAGMTSFEVMIAYLIVQFVLLFVQAILAFLIMSLVFKIQIAGPVGLAILLACLVGICGMSMGFLLATICSEEIQAILLAMGTFVPHMLLSGMMWPLEGMPIFLQYFSHLLPCTLAAEGMRSILTRGVGFTHPTVWPGFASIIAWIILYWILTILIHKLSSKK